MYCRAVIKVQAHGYGAYSPPFEARQVWLPAQKFRGQEDVKKLIFRLRAICSRMRDCALGMPSKRLLRPSVHFQSKNKTLINQQKQFFHIFQTELTLLNSTSSQSFVAGRKWQFKTMP